MKITKADVGRQVKLRDGRIAQIAGWDARDDRYPVKLWLDGSTAWRRSNGCFLKSGENSRDVVSFEGDKRTPDFTATQSQAGKRPLKANSQAFRFAKALLLGRKLTHQDFVRLLARSGITSNCPERRMREACKWLEKRGVRVQFKLEGKNPQHKRWFIVASAKASKLLTEMKGYA